MADDFKTPCCGFDTSKPRTPPRGEVLKQLRYPPTEADYLHAKSIICWNPGNRLVQCHNCGTIFIGLEDEVMLELITLVTDEQMAEAYRRAGKDLSAAAASTRQVLIDALEQFKGAQEGGGL